MSRAEAQPAVETVVVEATALSESRSPATASVSILDEGDLAAHAGSTVGETLRTLPGVEVVRSGGPGQPISLFIRGAPAEHTLVLMDGIAVNDPTSTSQAFDFSNLSTENVERIEIFRGPQSLRFGAGASAGVINIVTKKGQGPPQMLYHLEDGSYETQTAALALAGQRDSFNYSVGGSTFRSEGFSAADANQGNNEADSTSRLSFSTRLGWDFSKTTAVDFTARAFSARTDLDARGGAGGDDPNYTSTMKEKLAGVTTRSRFLKGHLGSSLGVYYSTVDRAYENPADTAHTTDYHEHFNANAIKVETRQEYVVDDISTAELSADYGLDSSSSNLLLNGAASTQSLHRKSGLGEALLYRLNWRGLGAEVGARHEDLWPAGPMDTYSVAPNYFWNASATRVRASLGTGFRDPSLFQLYSTYGSPGLKPEMSRALEVSLEQGLGPRAMVLLTYFANKYTNLIDFDNASAKYNNVAAARTRGLEVQTQVAVSPALHLKASYTALSTRDEATGLSLLRRAGNSLAAEVDGAWRKFSTNLIYRAVGERTDIDPISFARVSLPYYDVVTLIESYELARQLRVEVRIENLFNRQYQEIAGFGTAGLSGYLGVSGSL